VAKVEPTDPLLPSLLDRLIDEDPGARHEQPKSLAQQLRHLKQSVRRDLENLLNTRWRAIGWAPELGELEASIVNYGIPDFTGANLGSAGSRDDFIRIIQETIRRCEPRLKRVKVELVDNTEREDRTMRFRIDAMLQADPDPEQVVYDSALEPSSGNFRIGSAGGDNV
jgi:type VI secretion system protein ImpF